MLTDEESPIMQNRRMQAVLERKLRLITTTLAAVGVCAEPHEYVQIDLEIKAVCHVLPIFNNRGPLLVWTALPVVIQERGYGTVLCIIRFPAPPNSRKRQEVGIKYDYALDRWALHVCFQSGVDYAWNGHILGLILTVFTPEIFSRDGFLTRAEALEIVRILARYATTASCAV